MSIKQEYLKLLAMADNAGEALFMNIMVLGALAFMTMIAYGIGTAPYYALGLTQFFPGTFGMIVAIITGFIIMSIIAKISNALLRYAKKEMENNNE